MGENKQGTFLVLAVILFLLNIGLIKQVFLFKSELFLFELLFTVFLGLMALDSMNEFSKKNFSCFSVLSVYFGLNLINQVCLAVFSELSLNISMILVAGIGFIISIANITRNSGINTETFSGAAQKPIAAMPEAKKSESSVVKEYSPGKYLASKTGKKYHSPKCDFAKKIPKKNRVWFNSIEDAKKKGYGPCKCI